MVLSILYSVSRLRADSSRGRSTRRGRYRKLVVSTEFRIVVPLRVSAWGFCSPWILRGERSRDKGPVLTEPALIGTPSPSLSPPYPPRDRACPLDPASQPSPEDETEGTGDAQPQPSCLRPGRLIVEETDDGPFRAEREAQDASFTRAEGARGVDAIRHGRLDKADPLGHQPVDPPGHLVALVMDLVEHRPRHADVTRVTQQVQPVNSSENDERARVGANDHAGSPRAA
jgi:hypothetical protein